MLPSRDSTAVPISLLPTLRSCSEPTEAVRLGLKVQVAIRLRHDIRTLQTQEQRP
jgi:hypothetical protein